MESSQWTKYIFPVFFFFSFQWLLYTAFYSGSARVLGYTVYRGFLNRVYGILQLKYGYSVYYFL